MNRATKALENLEKTTFEKTLREFCQEYILGRARVVVSKDIGGSTWAKEAIEAFRAIEAAEKEES